MRFYADGSIVDEYATLIDPQRPIRASEYHGITDDDIAGAPTFREAWPDISRMLTGSVVVAHNLRFDDRFLAAELARAGQPAPHLVAMCSAVACRSQLEGPSYALQSLYRTATSQWFEDSHTALGDSRALATLVPWLLTNAPAPLWLAGPVPSTPRATAHPPGRIAPRAARLSRRHDGYLGAIARRFPLGVDHPVEPEAARQYVAALDEIITDQRITGDEGWHMELLARRAGFTQQRLVSEHRKAWERATANLDLERPERLSMSVRNQLVQLAHDLGHPTLATPLVLETAPSGPRTRYLRGWRIGVDGTGPAIEELTQLVVDNGGVIAQRITATVRLVIADDPGRASRQLERAREFDIPVLDPNEAREHLRPVLDAAAAAERQQQEEHNRWQAERDKYEAEQDAFFRHRWREVESPPEWDDERGDDELQESQDEGDWEETSTSLPTRSWQDDVAEIELPRGQDLLTAWERARNAQAGGLLPARAAELGAALCAEFDKYTEPG